MVWLCMLYLTTIFENFVHSFNFPYYMLSKMDIRQNEMTQKMFLHPHPSPSKPMLKPRERSKRTHYKHPWFWGTQVVLTFCFFCPRSWRLDIDHWQQWPEWDTNPDLYDSGQVRTSWPIRLTGSWSSRGSTISPYIVDICDQINKLSFELRKIGYVSLLLK